MSNGQSTTEETKKDEKKTSKGVEALGSIGKTATELGKTIETLFGPPSPAPFMPSHVSTGPPSVATPPGGHFNTQGAGGSLPQAPQGVPSPQPGGVGALQTGTEFSTERGAKGAVAASALSSVVGALHNIESGKKQEKIQHAQFLYDLVKTAYESGDEQTANIILQDDKNRKLIEKYLTGNLPRVPGQAMGETPAPLGGGSKGMGSVPSELGKGKVAGINQPGGIALPRPSQQSQMAAAVQNMIMQGIKDKDPRIMDKVLGEGTSSLSKEEYSTAMRSKFGVELSPAQVQVLDAKSQLALAETKADVLKYVIGQSAMADRMIAVAKIHAGAEVETGAGHDRARLVAAKEYRDFLLKLKGTAPDKMAQVMYQGLSKLYLNMATNSLTQAGKIGKDDKTLAKQFKDEAEEYVLKSEKMRSQYEAGKFLDDLLKEGVPDSETPDEKPPRDEDRE